jgi:hypothetical protein
MCALRMMASSVDSSLRAAMRRGGLRSMNGVVLSYVATIEGAGAP